MGSMSTGDPSTTALDPVVPKEESLLDGYTSSSASSPEADQEHTTQEAPPPQKRKGGRKPIYATSEERKQRNRQAQAAFRERRTEYIKQLETTIQHHEEALQNLQQSHRTAADECLMLRYKNSLLERILLEKGIDVQAELRLKGSPHLGPVRQGHTGQASTIQKAMINRQQQGHRHRILAPPPLQSVNSISHARRDVVMANSPSLQPTPPSQNSSPSTARSPGLAVQGGISSPNSDVQAQQHQQHHQRPLQPLQHSQFPPRALPQVRTASSSGTSQALLSPVRPPMPATTQPNYYPASFQKHYDQLEQEYDAQADMIDDVDGDDADTDNFIPNFRLPAMSPHGSTGMQGAPSMILTTDEGGGMHSHMLDHYDPILDADPFGLTASMHFPNQFTMPQTQVRR